MFKIYPTEYYRRPYKIRMEFKTHSMATPLSANTAIHMEAWPASPRIITRAFTARAKTTFCHAIRLVDFAMEIEAGTACMLEVMNTTSAASMAASAPLPIFSQNSYGTEVLLAQNGRLAGCLLIADTVKPEAAEAVGRLKQLHITTAMLTGDRLESARAVASETGIQQVHAKLLPEDKLTKLREIRKNNGAVMFVGDGINDAPVLAGADVGAAMGSGADAAIEAADVVFMTSNMQAGPALKFVDI